jgi:hypothetical protein
MLDEVHGDGIPWSFGDWELLEKSVRFMAFRLATHTRSTGPNIVPDKSADSGPGILTPDKLECLVNSRVTCKYVIVLILQYSESEGTGVRYIDTIVEK